MSTVWTSHLFTTNIIKDVQLRHALSVNKSVNGKKGVEIFYFLYKKNAVHVINIKNRGHGVH